MGAEIGTKTDHDRSHWTTIDVFATTAIQPTPSQYSDSQIVYSTRYEPDADRGIFLYDLNQRRHTLIQSWQLTQYRPIHNVMEYSMIQHKIYFVGGYDAEEKFKRLKHIFVFDFVSHKLSKLEMTDINDIEIGSNARIVLTNDDTVLHIVGGSDNGTHIVYSLESSRVIEQHSFHSKQPKLLQHALLYNRTMQKLLLFGGRDAQSGAVHTTFSMFDLSSSKQMISGFVRRSVSSLVDDHRYDICINDIIASYLGDKSGQWEQYATHALPFALYAFGYVLYDDRIVIIFGGAKATANSLLSADIYFLDLYGQEGWIKSSVQCPKSGYYNAVLIDNRTAHLLPYYRHKEHYCIGVKRLLPRKYL